MSYRADKLVIDKHTHGHTDPQTQAMTIPEGQNWPRVKIMDIMESVNGACLPCHPPARSGYDNTPAALKGCRVKMLPRALPL